MPPKKHQNHASLAASTLIIDNGAYNIKAGYSLDNPSATDDCQVIPNCIAKNRERKIFVGSQLRKCDDFGDMLFRRPLEKGFVVNWSEEKAIWDQSFFESGADLPVDPNDTNLILTEAPNCPQTLQISTDQIIFEEYEFASCYRCIGPQLNAFNDIPSLYRELEILLEEDYSPETVQVTKNPKLELLPAECLMLVDSGYSHTTITPVLHGRPINSAIRRLQVGGKFLTNALKETLSVQYYNLLDETVAVNDLKESLSFVSHDFRYSLDHTWKLGQDKSKRRPIDWKIAVDWVLPDYYHTHRGYSVPHDPLKPLRMRTLEQGESVVPISNERFQIPELLFSPSDIGVAEVGMAGAVMQSLEQLPKALWPGMLANVVIVGGNAKLEALDERLEMDLRMLAPAEMYVRVAIPPEPDRATWLGGARMARNQDLMKKLVVTRQEYLEHGHTLMHSWTNKQFAARGNAVAELMLP